MGKSLWYLADLEYDASSNTLRRISTKEVVEDFNTPLWRTAKASEVWDAIIRRVDRELEKIGYFEENKKIYPGF